MVDWVAEGEALLAAKLARRARGEAVHREELLEAERLQAAGHLNPEAVIDRAAIAARVDALLAVGVDVDAIAADPGLHPPA